MMTADRSSGVPQGPFESLGVFGESTVQGGGWLVRQEDRWADIVARLVEEAQEQPLRYYNAGLGASVIAPCSPGYNASAKPSATERLDKEVIAQKPDLLVIAYGLNDMRAGMGLVEFRAELDSIIDRVRAEIQPLIVIANVYHMSDYQFYPPFTKGSIDATKAYNQMLLEVAQERGYAYADVWSGQGLCDHVVHQDTCHANKVGNMLIAHRVFEAIVHAAPGIVANVQKRDETTEWTAITAKMRTEGVEKSDTSVPGQ